MLTCKHASWIMAGITSVTLAGCGDTAADAASFSETSSPPVAASEASLDALTLRPARASSAVRATSQVEFNAMELARLALHRTHDPAVRDFAQKMLDVHTQQRTWLRRVAAPQGLKVATVMDTVGQNLWSKLAFQSGAPFDRAFIAAVGSLQERGLQSISALEKAPIDAATAAWCEAATHTWQTEQDSSQALAVRSGPLSASGPLDRRRVAR